VIRRVEQHEGDGDADGRDDEHDSSLTKGCHDVRWTAPSRRSNTVRAPWCRCADVEELG
jgi:hypothetical protein